MLLVNLGRLDVDREDSGPYNTYIMRYDVTRNTDYIDYSEPLGHGFYLYTLSRIPVDFEDLFTRRLSIEKEIVVNE